MRIVIDIPEKVIKAIQNGKDYRYDIHTAIAQGTPLPRGHWLRMSDLSEHEDDRYKCSRCGNVVHHTNKMNLYTFNNWCGRCGSDNGRKD